MTIAAAARETTQAATQLTPSEYHQLLLKLTAEGGIYGKTQPVAGYNLTALRIVTENIAGDTELENVLKFDRDYVIVFDTRLWPLEYARKLAVQDTFVQWALSIVGEREVNEPHFKGPGLWIMRKNAFAEDYVPTAENNIYGPNPEGKRVCLVAEENMRIPTGWGNFYIPEGGTVITRERDLAKLVEALVAIQNGEKTIEKALYTKNDKGELVAAFDIWGTEGRDKSGRTYLERTYEPVAANLSTTPAIKAQAAVLLTTANSIPAPRAREDVINDLNAVAAASARLDSWTHSVGINRDNLLNDANRALFSACQAGDISKLNELFAEDATRKSHLQEETTQSGFSNLPLYLRDKETNISKLHDSRLLVNAIVLASPALVPLSNAEIISSENRTAKEVTPLQVAQHYRAQAVANGQDVSGYDAVIKALTERGALPSTVAIREAQATLTAQQNALKAELGGNRGRGGILPTLAAG